MAVIYGMAFREKKSIDMAGLDIPIQILLHRP